MTMQTPETQNWSEACLDAVRATTECVEWCVQNNDDGAYTDCIRMCLDASDLNMAAARLIMREGRHTAQVLKACADLSEACADECGSHADDHASVQRCTDACRRAADACRQVAQRLR